MSTIKIEKGIPCPEHLRGGFKGSRFPWEQMVPGDSFAVDVPKGKDAEKARQGLHSTACAWARRHRPGARFRVRLEENDTRLRIWLVSAPPLPAATITVHRLNTAEDDRHDRGGRTSPAPKAKDQKFAHDIPSFTDGAKARVVKGKRY